MPGCIATGKTVNLTLHALREALAMHFSAMHDDDELVPDPATLVTYLEAETPGENLAAHASPARR